MDPIDQEIAKFRRGKRVIERRTLREGWADGSSLGGATTGRRGNRLCLTVNVRWDDGKEYGIDSRALDPA